MTHLGPRHQELRLNPPGEPHVVHIRVLRVSSFLAGDRIHEASISPVRVRTKSATVSSELASDAIACACGTSDKHTSERFQTKIRTSLSSACQVRFA
jgi:hypothetical protein